MKEELPPNWIGTTIGEAFQVVFGQSPPSSSYNDSRYGLPFFQGKAEFSERYAVIKKWCNTPKKIAEKDDVLLTIRAPVGPTNLCPEKACIGRGLAAIRGVAGVSPLFILYFLRANEQKIARLSTGTTFGAITSGVLKNYPILLPPLREQRRIVSRIEEFFTQLDDGVRSLQQAQTQLEQYKQATLQSAYKGELIERKTDWIISKVLDLSENIHYGYTASASIEKKGPKFLRITDIQNGIVSWSEVPYCEIDEKLIKKYRLKKGDIVFARTGATVGKSYLISNGVPEAVFASYLIRIIIKKNILEKYVYYYFQTPEYWNQINQGKIGIGQPNVNARILGNIKIPLASIQEQEQIVEILDLQLSMIENIYNQIQIIINKEKIIRQSILKMAFEGKLVPQDSLDEPASMLLEKIRATKVSAKQKSSQGRLS